MRHPDLDGVVTVDDRAFHRVWKGIGWFDADLPPLRNIETLPEAIEGLDPEPQNLDFDEDNQDNDEE